jgi:hypothetical protein
MIKSPRQRSIAWGLCAAILTFCSTPTLAIPPEIAFPQGMKNLEDFGGGFLPLHEQDNNLDEGSYWYGIYQDNRQGYLVLQRLKERTADGKPIFDTLDVAIIPELANSNYGIFGRYMPCTYKNGRIFQVSGVLLLVKYNRDTATPVKSWQADFTQGRERWVKPDATLIKDLICYLEQP